MEEESSEIVVLTSGTCFLDFYELVCNWVHSGAFAEIVRVRHGQFDLCFRLDRGLRWQR
jgi:hypothetical protein